MRLVLCLLLALAAAPAWAEWVKVNADDEATDYIDPATIRKDSTLRRVWGITDLKQRLEDGKMSQRWLDEYDCKQERRRLLSISAHTDHMAGGTTLRTSNGSGKWQYIAPKTVGETILKIVCAQ